MPASGPSSAAATGVSFIGGSARAAQLRARRRQQQLPGRDHAAADRRSRRGRRCWRSSRAPRRGAGPPARAPRSRSRRPRARPRSPPCRRAPRPPASARPSAESGALSAAARPSRAIAVPEASDLDAAVVGAVSLAGRAVRLDHDVAELGARRRPTPGRARPSITSPPPIPVPIVSITAFVAPRAAPKRCSASTASVGVVVDRHRDAQALAASGRGSDVGELEVDGHDRDARAGGRSCTGSRARRRRPRGGPRSRPGARARASEELVLAQAHARRGRPVGHVAVGIDDPDQHLGAAEVHADCFDRHKAPSARRSREAIRQY